MTKKVLTVAVLLILAAGCGTRPLGEGEAARIGSRIITMEELERELQRIPPYQRAPFETLQGRKLLLNHIIERELLLAAAIDEGLENDSIVQAQVAMAGEMVESVRTRAMTQAFYQRHVIDAVTTPDSMVQAYYDENLESRFRRQASARVSHILVSSDEALGEAMAMLDAGTPFDSVAAAVSEHAVTRNQGGRMGIVEQNGSIPYIGTDEALAAMLLEAGEGRLVGPVETTLGTHLFLVTEFIEAGYIPLEEARESIEAVLKPALVNEYFKSVLIPELHERFNVRIFDEPDAQILATVGDSAITRDDVESAIASIPYYQRDAYDTVEGRQILLGSLIEQELLAMAASGAGMEQDSFVTAQVEMAMEQADMARKSALIQEYYNRFVVEAVQVPEERILEYYNSHSGDIYHREAQTRFSILVTERGEAQEQAQALIDAGARLDSLAPLMSIHAPTADVAGDIGWVTSGAPLPYMGGRPDFADELFAAPVGEVRGPWSTDLGITWFEVTETAEAGTVPLDKVRESIEAALKPEVVNGYLMNTVFPALRERYKVEINEAAFLPPLSIGPDSLLLLAQETMATDPETAIKYFGLFLDRYPDHEKCDQAAFLRGFTLSERLGDYDNARTAFQEMIDRFPESDLADDAQWMIENMDKPIEQFIPEAEETPVTQ